MNTDLVKITSDRIVNFCFVVILLIVVLITEGCKNIQSVDKPNFVIIFCDDMGYGDLGCFGSEANLPPSGYYAKNHDVSLEVFSATRNGKRLDYVHAPAYDYIDGRGHWIETTWGASDGQLIILKNEDGSRELIPYGTEKFVIALDRQPKTTIALDMDGNEMGRAKGELRGRMYHIQPVSGAVSYLLKF